MGRIFISKSCKSYFSIVNKISKQIRKQAGYEQLIEWDSKTVYPDQDTYRLFRSVSTVLKQTSEDTWETFGVWFFTYSYENGWDKFMNCIANDLHVSPLKLRHP